VSIISGSSAIEDGQYAGYIQLCLTEVCGGVGCLKPEPPYHREAFAMKNQRGGAILLCAILIASAALLTWSVVSTWRGEKSPKATSLSASNSQSDDKLPPPLESKGAKASLFYPVLKARGPQPGNSVVSKPLTLPRMKDPESANGVR
jgi:hypothetical protein